MLIIEHYDMYYLGIIGRLAVSCVLYERYGLKLLEKPIEGSDYSAMDRWYLKDLYIELNILINNC